MRKIYVFYADVFLLQNFLMDFLALLGANYYLRRRKRWDYLFLISLFFSVMSLLLLVWIKEPLLYEILVHIVLNAVMIGWAFGFAGKKEFIKNWFAVYFITAFAGGLFSWMRQLQAPIPGFLGMAAAAGGAEYGILRALLLRKHRGAHIYPAKLRLSEKTITMQAYWDTGNQLYDPFTGKCVSILAGARVRDLLPEDGMRFHYIPYHSLGEEHGLIRVINVDELLIFDEKQVVRMEGAAIGIAEKDLFAGKEYELILHSSVL